MARIFYQQDCDLQKLANKTVDYTRDSIVLRVTADSRRIDDFIDLMRDYEILEICRTGVVSLERGADTIRKVTNL